MGKNLKYGEFSFSTPNPRPSIKGYAFGGTVAKAPAKPSVAAKPTTVGATQLPSYVKNLESTPVQRKMTPVTQPVRPPVRQPVRQPVVSKPQPTAKPVMMRAKGGEASRDDMSQDKAMIKKAFRQHDAQEHRGGSGTELKLRKGGEARKKIDVKLVGMKLEPEAVVKKELSILKKGKAPAKIIKHEEREALMPEMGARAYKMGGKVSKYAEGGSSDSDRMPAENTFRENNGKYTHNNIEVSKEEFARRREKLASEMQAMRGPDRSKMSSKDRARAAFNDLDTEKGYARGGGAMSDAEMMSKDNARMKSAKPQQQRGRGAMTEREMQMMRQQREEQMDRAQNRGYEQHYSDMERENRADRQAVTDALMYVPRKIGEGARSAYDSVMGKKAGGKVNGYAFGGTPTNAPMGGAPQTQSNLQGAAGIPQYAQQAAQSGMPNQQQKPSPLSQNTSDFLGFQAYAQPNQQQQLSTLSQMSRSGQPPSNVQNTNVPPQWYQDQMAKEANTPRGMQRAMQQAKTDQFNPNAPTPPAWYQDMVAKQGGNQQGVRGAIARAQQAQPRSNPMTMGSFGNASNRNPSIKQGVGAAMDRAKDARANAAAQQAQEQAQARAQLEAAQARAAAQRSNSSGLGFNKGGSAKKGVPTYNRNPKC